MASYVKENKACEKGSNKHRLFMNIEKTKNFIEAGYSVSDIGKKLNLNESTVRGYIYIIEQAKINKQKLKESDYDFSFLFFST